jgi:hypothetical protein
MSTIGYGYGSEWHLLRWLGYHRDELSRRVAEELRADRVEWRDGEFNVHPRGAFDIDHEWVNLGFLEAGHPARQAWRATWPRASGSVGPHWDAIGLAHFGDRAEWILVEAKANLREVQSDCAAHSAASLEMIRAAFAVAGPSFGVDDTSTWLRGHYQFANRLTALRVMNANDAPAHLLMICICGDDAARYGSATGQVTCPPDEAGWRETLDAMHAHLGWRYGHGSLGNRVHEMFLPVRG